MGFLLLNLLAVFNWCFFFLNVTKDITLIMTTEFDVKIISPNAEEICLRLPNLCSFTDVRQQLDARLSTEDMSLLAGLINVKTERIYRDGDAIFLDEKSTFVFHRSTSYWHAKCLSYITKLVVDGAIFFAIYGIWWSLETPLIKIPLLSKSQLLHL